MSPGKVSTIDFKSFSNIVDGIPRSASTFHQGINPATGEDLWDVPIANEQDVDDAVAAGQKAFESWSQVPVEKRKEYLTRFLDVYTAHTDELVELLKKETGKPVRRKLFDTTRHIC